ncbi:hypothetical protein C2S42_02545 [Helicobacter pylori]|uniref:hypothetical protein n=1 Tax=Helicobacter pylori TaxID=210 RepID=UPI000D36F902|nr:hypothetical protein [Helicobacter pylori]PUB93749.1 hypothetical protein C2S42_02545 [Helicobacter pylori]
MKGISLIKIEFKGYAFELKKMIQQDAIKIKKGSKNNKNPSQSKLLEKEIEDHFLCLHFH